MKNKFRSDLAVAKNLGSAGSGSKHWWHQRFSAIIMLLTALWLFSFARELGGGEISSLIEVIRKPCNNIMLSLFVLAGFYHAALGMQVVVEDYVTCRATRLTSILLLQVFSIVTVLSFLVAVFRT
ncbi:MAG: succinate dehydrogenase, hydrophobic membrane anchor protein [Rickettsiaceae bacterium]|nr:succinate dehydrogenase, hydrophobic membrane anchor protein [Rickettsiaceae bacterium]